MKEHQLTPSQADELAGIALEALGRNYPFNQRRLVESPEDRRLPVEQSPIFHNCFDWHSSVHNTWALLRLLHRFPERSWRTRAWGVLDDSFRPEKVAGEVAYLEEDPSFEMPYGTAWLLRLCAEIRQADEFAPWQGILAPLENCARGRFARWLPRLVYPLRSGQHSQSAFALTQAFDWALVADDHEFKNIVTKQSLRLHRGDRDAALHLEPSAYDFLSPTLGQCALMSRLLEPDEFAEYLNSFAPTLGRDARLEPVTVVDREDGKLVHFDGLNLSRSWMLRTIATALPNADERVAKLLEQSSAHLDQGLGCLDSSHYSGTHWLGSFVVYALTS